VSFAIKSRLVIKNITSLPKGINDRLMTMQIPLSNNQHATILNANAPTMTQNPVEKDKFYEDFDDAIRNVPWPNMLIILGDINAWVGLDHETWERTRGKNGVGKCDSNGFLPPCMQQS
jgi:hypothetical protein